jgi:hypothetical protein
MRFQAQASDKAKNGPSILGDIRLEKRDSHRVNPTPAGACL